MNTAASDAPPLFLTPQEAAERLQISKSTVYVHLRSGELPGRKIGGSWRIPRGALVEMASASASDASRAAPAA